MKTLESALAEWTDFDDAAHSLAQCLGLIPTEVPMREAKALYWTDNPLGNELHATLNRLVRLGFLERRDEQYRTSPDFIPAFPQEPE